MTHLLCIGIASLVAYALICGGAVYFLYRFHWLVCIREVRPRQCCQHLLAYGLLLTYLLSSAWVHHSSGFLTTELTLASNASPQKNARAAEWKSATGASRYLLATWHVLAVVYDAVTQGLLQTWTQFSLTPAAAAAAATAPSITRIVVSVTLCAAAQVIAATCLYGSFAVWCHNRWRYTALRTAERHADLWAFLFPSSSGGSAAMMVGGAAAGRGARRGSMEQSSDSLTWGSLPPLTPSSGLPSGAAAPPWRRGNAAALRRTGRVGMLNTNATVRPQGRRLRAPLRGVSGSANSSSLSLPRFQRVGPPLATLSPQDQVEEDRTAEQQQQDQQRRDLLRVRQEFLSAFWLSDTAVMSMTFLLFSGLAVSRITVTIAVAAVLSAKTATATAWTSFTPHPTEGYVAILGLLFLAFLRLRLRRKSALLRELLKALHAGHSTSSGATAEAGIGAAASFVPAGLPMPRQRRARLQNVVNGSFNRSRRSSLGRSARLSGTALSPLSPMTPANLPGQQSHDAVSASGVQQQQQQPSIVSVSPSSLQSAAFYLNPDDAIKEKRSSSNVNTFAPATAEDSGDARTESFLRRWRRLLPVPWHRRGGEKNQNDGGDVDGNRSVAAGAAAASSVAEAFAATPAPSRLSSGRLLASAAAQRGTATAAASMTAPPFRFLALTTLALWAVQLFPDVTGVWASVMLTLIGCAAGTAQHALRGPVFWVLRDYRRMLQCSWWTLLVSRRFTPQQMDVTKAMDSLSPQQRRHLMVLQAFGTHHSHPSSTLEEDDDWVTEEANGSFAANALVEVTRQPHAPVGAASLAPSPVPAPVTTLTPDLAGGAAHPPSSDSVDTASLSASSAATAVAILGGVGDVEVGGVLADFDASAADDDDTYSNNHNNAAAAADRSAYGDEAYPYNNHNSIVGDDDGVVQAISPTQFWHGVATKVLQQSAAKNSGSMQGSMVSGSLGSSAAAAAAAAVSGVGGLMGGGSFAGPASTTLTGSFAAVPPLPGLGVPPMVQVSNGSLGDLNNATFTNTSFLGVTDPFRVTATPPLQQQQQLLQPSTPPASSATVIANALMPVTPAIELGGGLHPGFKKENLKGSMLLTAPAAARVGAAAAARDEEERQEAELRQRRQREQEEKEERAREEAAAAARAARAAAAVASDDDNTDFLLNTSTSETQQHVDDVAAAAAAAETEPHSSSSKPEGWLSRALATVVPGIVGSRSPLHSQAGSSSSTSSVHSAHATSPTQPSSPSELPADVVQSLSFAGSFSAATSATARALLQSEEGFERFLRFVRRDGDNTYALQGMLSAHGHTYGRRVDAKGRSALHYAVMGGFVHGVWFLIKIGAEPNLLDKAGYAPLHYAVLYHTEHCLSPTITDENSSRAVTGARHMLGIPVVATSAVQAPEQAKKRRQRKQQRKRRLMQQRLEAVYAATSSSNQTTSTAHYHPHDGSNTNDVSGDALMDESSNNSSLAVEGAEAAGPAETTTTDTTTTTTTTTTISNTSCRQEGREQQQQPPGTNPAAGSVQQTQHLQTTAEADSAVIGSGGPLDAETAPTSLVALLPTGPAPQNVDEDDEANKVYEEPVSSMAVVAAAAVVPEEGGQWYGMVGRLLSLGAQVDFPTARGLTALHLAVLQGSIGLINTLLREGANPLLGSELETQSFLSAANAAPWDEGCADAVEKGTSTKLNDAAAKATEKEGKTEGDAEAEVVDSSLAWIAQIHSEFQRPGERRRKQQQQRQQQQEDDANDKEKRQPDGTADAAATHAAEKATKEKDAQAPLSRAASSSGHSHESVGHAVIVAKQREWVDVHITNAGNPIAMGYCKSPLLLAVELDADLAVASMLHHATLQATTARVVAGLPGGPLSVVNAATTSNVLGDAGVVSIPLSQGHYSGVLRQPSSMNTSLLPTSPGSRATGQDDSPTAAVAAATANASGHDAPTPAATITTTTMTPLQRPPLVPSPSLKSSMAPSPTPQSVSANSKEPSFTAAYLSSVPPSVVPASSSSAAPHPLMEAGADGATSSGHVSFSAATLPSHAAAAAVATLLPLPTTITAVDSNSNHSSSGVMLAGQQGSPSATLSSSQDVANARARVADPTSTTADTIATTITALASTWARTCWERPCSHAFNAIHIALVLGNAQVARVLLLRWTYGGVTDNNNNNVYDGVSVNVGRNDGGGGIGGNSLHHPTISEVGLLSATTATSNVTTTTAATSRVVDSSATPLSTAVVALSPLPGAMTVLTPAVAADALLPPTVAQITVPVHDDGDVESAVFGQTAAAAGSADAKDGSPLRATPDPSPSEAHQQQHHHHHHRHHHTHTATSTHDTSAAAGGAAATATLSLTTSIGASAFWVVPLRLNFFHLAAIGDSTECLAYVLRWRGVPDYIPCALDDAFRDEVQAEESRRDINVALTATAAQDAYHRRRTHHREQKRVGNHPNARGAAEIIKSARSAKVSPVLTSDRLPAAAAVALTLEPESGPAAPATATPEVGAEEEAVAGTGAAIPAAIMVDNSFPESPSSSSDSGASGTRTGGNATAVPTLRTAVSETGSQSRPPHLPPQQQQSTPANTDTLPQTAQEEVMQVASPVYPSAVLPPLPSSPSESTTQTAEFAAHKDVDAATASSSISDLFNRTWSSGRPSQDTASSGTAPHLRHAASPSTAAALPPVSRRAHRLRAKQRNFMRAFVTLLQTNIRGDAVRRRVRTTVFGRGGAGAVLRHVTDPAAAGAQTNEEAPAGAATAWVAPLSDDANSVLSKTCFGSTAAAAALHTGMTICYATMNNLLNEDAHRGANHEDDDDTSSYSSASSSTSSSDDAAGVNGLKAADAEASPAPPPKSIQKVIGTMVQNRLQKRRDEHAAQRQLREQERLHHLRQQRRRAFVSAVAKLRQCIVGVPIDLAHLAAVEMAVDRACVALPTAKARRTLQQALLIVTRRLQNQNRRQHLVNGLRRSAAAVVAQQSQAASADTSTSLATSTISTSNRSATRGPTQDGAEQSRRSKRRPSSLGDADEHSLATSASFTTATSTTTTTTTTTDNNNNNNSHRCPPNAASSRDTSTMAEAALRSRAKAPSLVTSNQSFYSTLDHNTERDSALGAREDDSPSAQARRARRRRFHQQQRLQQLLTALAAELNAVDTRGLTPLHYAIANQNASMVYLLCAYGATFVFASEQTEAHLVGHPVEAVAAAAAAALDGVGGNSNSNTHNNNNGNSSSLTASIDEVDNPRLAATMPATVAPTTPSSITVTPTSAFSPSTITTAAAASPRSFRALNAAPHVSVVPISSAAASPGSPIFASTVAQTSLAAVRAQLAAPGISAATDVLSYFSEHYYTQLTPTTQEALRRAAKTGSAEYLLLRLPTRAEAATERQRLLSDHPWQASARAAATEVDVTNAEAGMTPAPSRASLPPFAPTGNAVGAMASPASSCSSRSSSQQPAAQALQQRQQQQQQSPLIKPSMAHPTTMAATLTEALGLGVNGSFTAAAAGALNAGNKNVEKEPVDDDSNGGGDTGLTSMDKVQDDAHGESPSAEEKSATLPHSKAPVTAETTGVMGAAAAAVPSADLEDSLQGLQAQLLDQEGKVLQLMVKGVCEVTNGSITIPLPSADLARRDDDDDEGREGWIQAATAAAATNGGGGGGRAGSDERSSATPPLSVNTAGTATAEEAGNASAVPTSVTPLGSQRSATAPNKDPVTTTTPKEEDGDSYVREYALLEPHDVFLTHMVRNPAKADSIVRAAMEGTALRYLFQASVAAGKMEVEQL